jgi:hypothetical protein
MEEYDTLQNELFVEVDKFQTAIGDLAPPVQVPPEKQTKRRPIPLETNSGLRSASRSPPLGSARLSELNLLGRSAPSVNINFRSGSRESRRSNKLSGMRNSSGG